MSPTMSMPDAAVPVRELSFASALREAVAEEMRRDDRVVLLGVDVRDTGGGGSAPGGLVAEFGVGRIIDTPISEAGVTALAVGAAMTGLRPIVDLSFGDFLTLALDPIVNQAAKIHYMSGGAWNVPLVVRATLGAPRRLGAQHSQSLQAWPCHIPGLKVVMPSSPAEAKALLKTAVRDDNPVLFFEDATSDDAVSPVPEGEHLLPLGVADVKRSGTDITLVATGRMVRLALAAAASLEQTGIDAEVIDPRTLWPLDERTLIESVRKTSRCLVIDQGHQRYGASGEIASVIQEGAFYELDAPVRRLAAMQVPVPFSPVLEDATLPTERDIVDVAQRMCGR